MGRNRMCRESNASLISNTAKTCYHAMAVLLWQKKKTAHFMTITPVSKSFPLSKKVFSRLENQQKGSIYYGKCSKAQ